MSFIEKTVWAALVAGTVGLLLGGGFDVLAGAAGVGGYILAAFIGTYFALAVFVVGIVVFCAVGVVLAWAIFGMIMGWRALRRRMA